MKRQRGPALKVSGKTFDLEQHMWKRERQLKNAPTRHELLTIKLLRKLSVAFAFQKGFLDRGRNYNYGNIYVVDFYLPAPWNLVLEIDGKSHKKDKQQEKDAIRDSYFVELGLRVVRVTNAEVRHMTARELLGILKGDDQQYEQDPAKQFQAYIGNY